MSYLYFPIMENLYNSVNLLFVFSEPREKSDTTSAVVKDLLTCETYLFAIGLIGPLGYGPISTMPSYRPVVTVYYPRAPPRHLGVRSENGVNATYMIVHWNSSCPTFNNNNTAPRYVVSDFLFYSNVLLIIYVLKISVKLMFF